MDGPRGMIEESRAVILDRIFKALGPASHPATRIFAGLLIAEIDYRIVDYAVAAHGTDTTKDQDKSYIAALAGWRDDMTTWLMETDNKGESNG
jgi:hypothetical protein